ncbi:hypothetical protein E1301_Tti000999 [Triplophysa tibetana]|uniref:Uncharacterized protein n=1 Tax=Triplophysa tibetana TaxID=1572043 RepID=A0A5A9N6W1_9TELE|nr:hypothetical protein E1301_Tti000999 [Triplophysa tibetana]
MKKRNKGFEGGSNEGKIERKKERKKEGVGRRKERKVRRKEGQKGKKERLKERKKGKERKGRRKERRKEGRRERKKGRKGWRVEGGKERLKERKEGLDGGKQEGRKDVDSEKMLWEHHVSTCDDREQLSGIKNRAEGSEEKAWCAPLSSGGQPNRELLVQHVKPAAARGGGEGSPGTLQKGKKNFLCEMNPEQVCRMTTIDCPFPQLKCSGNKQTSAHSPESSNELLLLKNSDVIGPQAARNEVQLMPAGHSQSERFGHLIRRRVLHRCRITLATTAVSVSLTKSSDAAVWVYGHLDAGLMMSAVQPGWGQVVRERQVRRDYSVHQELGQQPSKLSKPPGLVLPGIRGISNSCKHSRLKNQERETRRVPVLHLGIISA